MKIPHVAIYCRVSTMAQVDDGISLENQPVMVLAELDKKFGSGGFTFVIFKDEGKSGGYGPKPWATARKSRDRKGLFEMIQRLNAGEFTHVAAYHPDRLYRDHLAHMALYSEVMKPKGAEFIFVTGSFDTSNEGRFAQGVIAGVAELQRHQSSENIRRNLNCKREEGYCLGTRPFGWRRETAEESVGRRPNIAPVPEQRDVVIRIKDMFLSGMSTQAIALALNRENTPHRRTVGRWRSATVILVLNSPTHAGLVRLSDGSLKPGLHYEHRFYDESELGLITARFSRNRKRLLGVHQTQPFRLFSGLAICGHCGKNLQGSFHTESPTYRCLGQGVSDDGSHVFVSAKYLEERIVSKLGEIARSPELLQQIEDSIESLVRGQDEDLRIRLGKVKSALKDNKARIGRVMDAISSGTILQTTARDHIEALEEASQNLSEEDLHIQKQLSAVASRTEMVIAAKRAIHKFTEVWDFLTDAERREALHISIEKLEVFAREERKWLKVKFVFHNEPLEIELVRGAERYRSGKLDGMASLTARELAALKHVLDGADYKQIAKYFDSTVTNAWALINRASRKLGAQTPLEAAKMAESHIRRVQHQLPLFGKASLVKHSPKKLKTMEYQILLLKGEGKSVLAIAEQTGLEVDRVQKLLDGAMRKLDRKTVKAALKRLEAEPIFLPPSMTNRRRIG